MKGIAYLIASFFALFVLESTRGFGLRTNEVLDRLAVELASVRGVTSSESLTFIWQQLAFATQNAIFEGFLMRSVRELKCCYKATTDGFSATSFHNCSDFKGPCVIIGYKNDNSFKFGAFNPEGYRRTDDYYDTFDAFLLYWENHQPLFDYVKGGPQFGSHGLLIGPPLAPVMGAFAGPKTNSGIGDLRHAKCRFGLSYAKRGDWKASSFGDESKVILDEVQVFCSPQIASLY